MHVVGPIALEHFLSLGEEIVVNPVRGHLDLVGGIVVSFAVGGGPDRGAGEVVGHLLALVGRVILRGLVFAHGGVVSLEGERISVLLRHNLQNKITITQGWAICE